MPEEIDEKIQVDTTKVTAGKIRIGGKGFLSRATPSMLARVNKALRYFAVSLITMISGTDLFTGGQVKITCFCLGVFILALGGVDILIGVETEKKE